MNDRERLLACILGESVDRVPFYLFWPPWNTTIKRWQNESEFEYSKRYKQIY